MLITGKEKAFVGGLGAGITTLAGQLSVGGKLDTRTIVCSLGAWVVTHVFVYYTTNSSVLEKTPELLVASPPAPTDSVPSV